LIGHGTEVTSVAAGTTVGVAPGARIFSISLPNRTDGSIDMAAVYYAFEMLCSPTGISYGRKSLVEVIDTVLLANGTLHNRAVQDAFDDLTFKRIVQIHDRHNVAIVAAAGSQPTEVAFPSRFQLVFSVGSLDTSGNRFPNSGYGFDTTGTVLPNGHVCGEKINCETSDGSRVHRSGTSYSAALVAGLFCLLAAKGRQIGSRWARINSATVSRRDSAGDLRVIDFKLIK